MPGNKGKARAAADGTSTPPPNLAAGSKRKAGAEGVPGSAALPPKTKKPKPNATAGPIVPFEGMLPATDVIEYIRADPGVTSDKIVAQFKSWCKNDQRNQKVLLTIIKRVADKQAVDGKFQLTLKPGF